MGIRSSWYFSSFHYFISHRFIIFVDTAWYAITLRVDSINFKLVAFICLNFFLHMQTMSSSVVRISELCFCPMKIGMKYNLFCLYLSFTKELFPSPSRPSYCQAGYDSEDVIWKKSTEKKGFPPINKNPPLLIDYDLQILRCKFNTQFTTILKHTFTSCLAAIQKFPILKNLLM